MADHDELTRLLDAFGTILTNDPGPLWPNDKQFVPNLHGTATDDVIETLARSMRRRTGSALYYFSGQRGTGKSTELRRLVTLMNGASKCRAYMCDALSFIGENHPIQIIDLLLVSAVGFAACLKADTKIDFLKDDVATRFGKWLESEVRVTGFEAAGVKFTADFKASQQSVVAFIQAWDLGRQERFETTCREFIRDMSRFVRKRYGVDEVVLIVDSLERLRASGSAATDMFERVVNAFDGGSDSLRFDETQVVYAVPPYLPYLTNVKHRVQLFELASVRVREPPSKARRAPRDSGLNTMSRVITKRFADWDKLLQRKALDQLALASGGDLRQLLRRFLLDTVDAAYYALDRLPLAADDEIIGTVIDRHRIEFEQMVVQQEYGLLKGIAEDNKVQLPSRTDWPAAARFFDIRAVLNHRNGTDWVDLNPLLWPLIDAYQPPKPDVSTAAVP